MTLRRLLSIALATVALALAACGDDDEGFTYQDDGQLQVMTRNLYLGADLAPLFEPGIDTTTFLVRANAALGAVLAPGAPNGFSARAGALADEIAAFRPDLVGLQEATLWRTQIPGDGPATPAPVVLQDFLSMLQAELLARGTPYDVAEEIDLFDVEVPVPLPTGGFQDFRLTDRQVILAIAGLPTSNPRSAVFADAFLVPITLPGGGPPILVKRGWTAVNATVGGRDVAFYNAHLEAFSPLANAAQGSVLRAVLDADPLSSVAQVLVGDLNSEPGQGLGYDAVAVPSVAFSNLWDAQGAGSGLTCCFDPILTSTNATLEERIDHILSRGAAGRLTPTFADRVGEDPADRTGSPARWPSDHAGVVGTFRP